MVTESGAVRLSLRRRSLFQRVRASVPTRVSRIRPCSEWHGVCFVPRWSRSRMRSTNIPKHLDMDAPTNVSPLSGKA
jgi:hypothetical protein